MTLCHSSVEISLGKAGAVSARTLGGLLSGCLMLSAGSALAETQAHLLSAQRHAGSSVVLQKALQKWCHGHAAPALTLAMSQAEERFKEERTNGKSQQVQRLIERECLAYRLTLQDPTLKHPVWYLGQLKVLKVKRGTGDSLEVTARAYSLAGPIVNSRLTFSTGLHHSCFGYSDAQGLVSCRLIDTHPHGEAGEADHEPTDGILVASLQGKVTQDAIEWPTQITVKIKH
ncbi:hypothetical protein PSQ20_20470 [Curvibacter sp. RS43]|uniref:hypothetical protein n=1 Tax=Curvibacter microcysteis TaxID=3026419 RepID=UPI00236169EE|nr:hypothetical protein [Curvibacter sp. RS43]MDD0812731.1 hypothetical protein [Curvibacter sp. RS43]